MNAASGDGAGSRRSGDTRESLEQTADEARNAGLRMAESHAEEGQRRAAATASSTAEVLDEVASGLSARGEETLAGGARAISEQLSALAGSIEHANLDELLQRGRQLARDNPLAFAAAGVALGLVLSRLFRASGERASGEAETGWSAGTADEARERRPDDRPGNGHAWKPPGEWDVGSDERGGLVS